ncbi:CHAT domain-containing protein [Catenulispora rubra]|uniref:CHAT domain-containing protein n=1 Tax=Catenulispora rubra TaxID=280293 RepID=UPI0018921E58|nr:CHAT domain-containing protein [Catenulispora rubra]
MLDVRQGGPREVASAQLRHERLTRVSLRKVRALIGVVDSYLDLTVAGAAGLMVVELFGSQVTNEAFAHWFAGLVASHRLKMIGGRSAEDDAALQRYILGHHDTLPPVGRTRFLTWAFPGRADLPGSHRGNLPTASQPGPSRSVSAPPREDLDDMSAKAVAKAERGGRRNLRAAIHLFHEVVAATPRQDVDRPGRLSDLALALNLLFEETYDPAVRDEAIDVLREAWKATPTDDADRLARAVNLSTELLAKFELVDDMALLYEADATLRETASAVISGHPDLPAFHATYGNVLQSLYEQTGDAAHIMGANQAHRSALKALGHGSDTRVTHLASLGATLSLSFEATGDLDHLRESIKVQRHVLSLTARHPSDLTTLVNLSHALQLLAERTGQTEALVEAVKLARDARRLSRRDDTTAASGSALASALTDLFELTGDLPSLVEAVETCREVVAASPRRNLARARALGNLANTVSTLYERTLTPEALEEARQAGREAIDEVPPDHPDRAQMATNHGVTMMLLYERSLEYEHLAEAITAHREALGGLPAHHPDQASVMSNLSVALRVAYEASGDEQYAEESVRISREAAGLTHHADADLPDNPDHFGYLYNLGTTFKSWADRTVDDEVRAHRLSQARQSFAEAAKLSNAKARFRLAALQGLGWVAMKQGDSQAALTAYERTVELLPQIASPRLRRSDREHGLGQLAGLAAEAASAAVAAGRPDRAVELLEQARGVLLSERLEVRGGLAELRLHAPELAAKLAFLRDESDRRDTVSISSTLDRRQPEQEWAALLEEIRTLPGFEEFLLPVPVLHLQPEALEGPIVLVYVSPFRADALILTPDVDDPVKVVELRDLSRTEALANIDVLHSSVPAVFSGSLSERAAAHTAVETVLGWLWEAVTRPVLTALGLMAPLGADELPRIWWCPIGQMAFLPLHAAGPADRTDDALDRVVSSYTPTIRALGHARRSRVTNAAEALVIAMPETPDHSPLPGAAKEVDLLAAVLPSTTVFTGRQATHQAVVTALPRHRIAHFSCHGYSDWSDPAASLLVLHDHLTAPLTVMSLSRLHLVNAGLAFLSACSTSQSNLRLADEAVHITTALQMAGFAHVVGTLWTVDDKFSLYTSEGFYRRLTEHVPAAADITESARALHATIRELRDAHRAHPALWAAHIHIGP